MQAMTSPMTVCWFPCSRLQHSTGNSEQEWKFTREQVPHQAFGAHPSAGANLLAQLQAQRNAQLSAPAPHPAAPNMMAAGPSNMHGANLLAQLQRGAQVPRGEVSRAPPPGPAGVLGPLGTDGSGASLREVCSHSPAAVTSFMEISLYFYILFLFGHYLLRP